jgi:hypothetical protein
VQWKREYRHQRRHGWRHQCQSTSHVGVVAGVEASGIMQSGPANPSQCFRGWWGEKEGPLGKWGLEHSGAGYFWPSYQNPWTGSIHMWPQPRDLPRPPAAGRAQPPHAFVAGPPGQWAGQWGARHCRLEAKQRRWWSHHRRAGCRHSWSRRRPRNCCCCSRGASHHACPAGRIPQRRSLGRPAVAAKGHQMGELQWSSPCHRWSQRGGWWRA